MDIREHICLVTGAARGIGRATALALAERGGRLVLCDRRRDEVDELARQLGRETLSYGVDVSNRAEVGALCAWVRAELGGVDVLVNNAGVLSVGTCLETPPEDFERVFAVNFWGVLHMTQAFAPLMVERGRGAIVQIASASGRLGFAPLAAYSASKFAVVGLSQSLDAELRPHGIQVSAVCPGMVHTTILEGSEFSAQDLVEYEKIVAQGMAPERVAAKVIEAIEHGTPVLDVGWDAHLMSWAARLAPQHAPRWAARIAGLRAPRTANKPSPGEGTD